MKRENIDFHAVLPQHEAVHSDLTMWARWASPRGGRGAMHPMFKGYVPYLYPEVRGGGEPIDSLRAIAVQKNFAVMPERHRWAIHWVYLYPFIGARRVRGFLGVTEYGLMALIHDGRSMIKNACAKGLAPKKEIA